MGRRVLFTAPAGLGHIHPMVPLARATVARGHDVLWAVPVDGIGHIERTGIPTVAIAPAGLTSVVDVRRRYPELDALPPLEVGDVMFGKLFGAIAAPHMLAGLAPVALEWQPDLVVADAAEFAGHIMAAELGVPSITKGFGPLLPERRTAAAGEEVAPLWRSRGLEPRSYGGAYDHLYLDIYPPGLQPEAAAHVPRRQLLRPVVDDGQLETSSPLPLPAARSDAPLVYVTMGTVFNNPEPLKVVLTALGELDVRTLVTVGPQADPDALGMQPDHVRVERYVPQSLVLPHCDVVVSHAGSGTVLAALTLGLPQVCLPQGADQFLNAAAVASSGVGISLMPGEGGAGAVRDGVARVLEDVSFRDAAWRVSSSIASMPSPDDVAVVLETFS
ncbi:MAG TPA: glycosyltransferase [Acidimicrobiia bacterium]|jgi:UDP:flavonoid glycosyltransferase YjiC (YdhE family)|nr:glycosyltransferase [Acidimicrobiia bacterium]